MIKNILNYTKNLICFAVSSLLLLSSSTAVEFIENENFNPISNVNYSWNNNNNWNGLGYSLASMHNIIKDYVVNNSNENAYNTLISNIHNNNYNIVIFNDSTFVLLPLNSNVGVTNRISDSIISICTNISTSPYVVVWDYYDSSSPSYSKVNSQTLNTTTYFLNYVDYLLNSVVYSDVDVYNIEWNGSYSYYWDGTYYYSTTPPTPPEPSYIPTNEEIADKVQEFYDSDFFQNQSDFKDFFVLYNYNNETFSFIGHNLGDDIGQIVYRANFPQNTTGVDYWSFYLVDLATHIWNWFNNYYWLYSTTLDSEIITYNGKGAVTDLLELKFDPTYSTIVYSTTDYPCQIYGWDDTNHEITVESETIAGDFYTYDENIDPTTSEYNPITNYVLPNSIDTLLSNADTSSLFNLFVVPDFSNMEWILLVIGVFWGYFGGFVLLTCVLLFIYWVLRGV